MTFWRSKLHILLIYIVLQSYEVIVQRAKGSKRTKYVSWLNMNFYLLTGYIYYVYKKFWICKCYVLGNQMDATLQKNVLKEKKSKRWLLSGKDTFSGHELGFSLRASVKIWCEWFHWTKVTDVEETPWVLGFPNQKLCLSLTNK